ncbi:hypothetical protein B0F90DRAFT_24416 [Multifurca ochricompacta]|uniref:Uncharacterized protein n=1 Tax=Multifurca ochricompacta TaxID=376703 RepID=A0AAD4MDC7_9AGAM|nr:hypothetical protein B0F90DRAFT_24416 [Multifurca ochricompacta]
MDTLESQPQDRVMTNGVVETSSTFPPSPPQLLVSTLSELSRAAEQQGKDGSTPPHTIVTGTTAPTKKFTVVNINKKFMEKNSPTPGTSQIPSSSASSKIAGSTVKSPPPSAASHSRLVTTKLTRLLSSSTGTGPGWTRPPSTAPSLAPSPVSGSVSSVLPSAPAPISHGAPQHPHAGKVIQPQPRGAIQAPSTSKSEGTSGSSKPAWRNVKQDGNAVGAGPPPGVQSEFPTAAEVAQGRLNGVQDKRPSTHAPAPQSPATTEADTFRGVHLNPNAHHWDEVRSLSG